MSKELEALSKALIAAVGENDVETEPTHWLDMAYPPLNHILSGSYTKGLPGGRIIEIYGPSASGKTLLATMAMIAAQRAGGVAVFIDWERAFNAKFAQEVGLDTTFPRFIYKRSETWESGNEAAKEIAKAIRKGKHIPDGAPIVVVFDSIAAAVPKSMLYDAKGEERALDSFTMHDSLALAKTISNTIRLMNQHVGKYEMTAIYLNQIRVMPGVTFGDPITTPGGKAMEFYASIRIALGAKKLMSKDDAGGKEFLGRLIGFETKKNKVHRPFQNTDLRLTYDEAGLAHFDMTLGLIEHLLEKGKLVAEGKMVVWNGKKYYASALAKKIDSEGVQAELIALLHS